MVEPVRVSDRAPDEPAPGVLASQLGAGERVHGQHVHFEPDTAVDAHEHPHEQITYVLDGTVTMTIDGEDYDLSAGDSVIVPGGTPHAARTEEAAEVLDVFSPPREDLLE